MRYFVGNHPLNNVPIGNGRVLVLLQQYGLREFKEEDMKQYTMRKPVDRISYIFYPYYHKDCSVLGDAGIYTTVNDSKERIRYDFYETWNSPFLFEKATGYISVDRTRFVNGTGIYEVISHKGYNVVKTTTWVPYNVDAFIRRIEVTSYLKDNRFVDIYPQIHLKGKIDIEDKFIVSKITNCGEDVFLAIGCPESKEWHFGDFQQGLKDGFNKRISGKIRFSPNKANLSFRVTKDVTAGRWSKPVHIVIGFGRNKKEAIANIKRVIDAPIYLYGDTFKWWNRWLASGTLIETSDEYLNYLWRVSKTILKMSMQYDGLMVYIGYLAYQGGVWIRDNAWVSMCLSQTGHTKEALQILNGLKCIIKKREDGNFCFAYDCGTKKPIEFTTEMDSTGLLLTALWYYYIYSGDLEPIKGFWDLIEYSAEWICRHRDKTGMIIPCAGIWEDFCPRRGRNNEHMIWTSGVSAFGLKVAALMAERLNEKVKSKRYSKVYRELKESILRNCVKDGILCRAKETDQLDSSVLTFFTWMPIFYNEKSLLKKTIKAIEYRIKDPLLGGIWRHEDSNVDLGDVQPWPCSTLWLAEAYLKLGMIKDAWTYLNWVIDNTSHCGLIPEHLASKGIPVGISMPSYSQGGFLAAMLRHANLEREKIKLPRGLKYVNFTGILKNGKKIDIKSKIEKSVSKD